MSKAGADCGCVQVTPPLGGYRYAQIHTSGQYDPEAVYIAGSLNCPAFVFEVSQTDGWKGPLRSQSSTAVY